MAKRILVLEDHDLARRGIATMLEQEGNTVLRARNALEAQALCAEGNPDVAIVDIELPGLKGNEWALHLKETSPDTRISLARAGQGWRGWIVMVRIFIFFTSLRAGRIAGTRRRWRNGDAAEMRDR